MPESQLRQRIRHALQRAFPGALVIGWPANFWTGSGWPDLLYLDWPLLLGLEVKQGRRSKPTPVQGARHSLLRMHHVPVYVVHTPAEAIDAITALKEKLPMAFDPSVLAELEAALAEEPVAAPEPEPVTEMVAAPAYPALEAGNGEVLDTDLPAPDIEDLTAAIVANEEIAQAQADEAIELAGAQVDILVDLKQSIDKLTDAMLALNANLSDEPSEAPRRGRRRSS